MAEKTGFIMDFRDFDKKFEKVVKRTIPQASAKALYEEAPYVLRDAIMETPTVPKSRGVTKGGRRGGGPGHLRRSQKIERPLLFPDISVELGFNAEYAAYVHEMPRSYLFTIPGSGPKYLESKLIKNKEKYMKNVARRIREASGK